MEGDEVDYKDDFKEPKNFSSEIDFEWAFGLNRILLNLIGVWPTEKTDENAKVLENDSKRLRIPMILIMIMLGLIVPQLYALIQVYRELQLVIDNLTTSYCAMTAGVKLFFLWKSRQAFGPVLQSALLDWSSAHGSLWERQVMVKQANRARIFTLSGYVIMTMSLVGFLVFPFFGLSIRIINNITDPSDAQRYLPVQSRYPFETSRSPYFEITYISQIIVCYVTAACFSVPDYFFGALVFHASAQCEILGARVSELLPHQAHGNPWLDPEFFRARLRRLVRRHVHLIRFVNTIENCFNIVILGQALCLTLSICFLGFGTIKSIGNKGATLPIVQVATLGGSVFNLMIHMLVYCIASEILAQQSVGFRDAIYCSDWYLLPANYARDLIPIIMRSRIPLHLSAGKFFYLSLNAFLNIIKTSFGYVSMLLAVSS